MRYRLFNVVPHIRRRRIREAGFSGRPDWPAQSGRISAVCMAVFESAGRLKTNNK